MASNEEGQKRTWAMSAEANDDITFPEEDSNEDFIDSFVSPEPFLGEADIAEQANELAATSVELPNELETSFLQYALSIIMGRALPDARDGLKPVHRRILFAMSELSLLPNQPHRKCARVVGEVLGKFHPHGDMAVYDALVRMAQDFSSGTPLIDGHGNFGSIDADPAAAMRYTECRLTRVAHDAMLQDLYEETVDFVPNFDGNEQEPLVLPSKLPMLLLNGCSGIAVGMATNVPPHNLMELLDGCMALVDARSTNRDLSDEELFRLIPGPDFPTHAKIMGLDGAKRLYSTGNGGIVMRASAQVETVSVGKSQTRTAIVVTALPYHVNKALFLERTANLVNEKKLEGIADLRDESDRDGIRVVIELKRDAVPAVVLNNLYKKTPLQTTFSGNFLALMDGGKSPQRFTLRSALDCFLDFRFETIRRRSAFRLRKVENRVHIVEGLLLALAQVDNVIEWVRKAIDSANARESLMTELGLSREQADSVLRLQLGQLTRLNKDKLENEKKDLELTQRELQQLMTKDDSVYTLLKNEFEELQDKYGIERRTTIELDGGTELSDVDLVRNSRSIIVVTRGGYIKRMPLKTFETQRRKTRGKRGTSDSSDGDDGEVAHCFTCNDHDTLLMVTQRGIAFGLRAFQVPKGSRTARGQPIPSVLPINNNDVVTTILPISAFSEDEYIVLITEKGRIKRTALVAFEKLTSRGLTIASLQDNDRLMSAHIIREHDELLVATKYGMATRFTASNVRPSSRTSRGVNAMKLKEGDSIQDMNVLSMTQERDTSQKEYILAVTAEGSGKKVSLDEFRTQARGGIGVVAIKFKTSSKNDQVVCLRSVHDDDEILIITTKGIIVRQRVRDIPTQGRQATGVFVQKLDDGDRISTVSVVPKYEERGNESARGGAIDLLLSKTAVSS